MNKSRLLAAVAFGAAIAVSTAGGAQAVFYYEARYQGTMSSATTVVDTSGNLNDGTVGSANGGAVTSVIDAGSTNPYLHFSGNACASPGSCEQSRIVPAVSSTLIPNSSGSGTFAFGASVRIHNGVVDPLAGMNVFQYGFAVAGASQWKLQVDKLTPSCRWADGTNEVLLKATGYTLPDNTWVKMKCSRLSATSFELRVTDPATGTLLTPAVTTTATMGAIVPTGSATIGAKTINSAKQDADTDQFRGDMDDIFFHRD
ncbi:hypothetical protein [Catellatospora citrea]|uniref:Ribosomally synthesized peptide with SipW-like signal peptide n=1 Tax=Catellatospora citrea TaxID=53366 RepID=A0A8J3K520_9ACTN|nr:hypothetical protein [Catellatospora citrea]RKE05513.1 hypothetical protein C8E86_0314 [Catellatospora citrea]GIF96861.1 hypothetical protein Cci01nite_19550 [Catellatospora citrea]